VGTRSPFEEMKETRIHKFVGDQLSRWPLACNNFRALKDVRVRELEVGGLTVKLQFNPARMISSEPNLQKRRLQNADASFVVKTGRQSRSCSNLRDAKVRSMTSL
jgi:hypothetical protein